MSLENKPLTGETKVKWGFADFARVVTVFGTLAGLGYLAADCESKNVENYHKYQELRAIDGGFTIEDMGNNVRRITLLDWGKESMDLGEEDVTNIRESTLQNAINKPDENCDII